MRPQLHLGQISLHHVQGDVTLAPESSTNYSAGFEIAPQIDVLRALDEVAPPGSTIAIALVPPSEGRSEGSDETHCALTTQDIEADHATLSARGVEVDAEIARKGTPRPGLISMEVSVGDPVPPQFFFRDIDGNRFLIVEPG